ncbi:MAG: response regulator [Desulfovibrio sp.]|uniref:response regulator n=1 Tax=Desulfovibrio sp. 7SRBS1 TaxID=3378064 RepID=UPI003B3F9573
MNNIRVLVVEDDAHIADLHRRFTERVEGCDVVGVAYSLDEAREMVEVLEPDLVLLDLYFPEGQQGTELLREIRAKGLETDVVLITAAREVGPLKEALRGGVFDYLIKPVIAARFNECLTKYRHYRSRLSSGVCIGQGDVDKLLHSAAKNSFSNASATLPKGIDPLTLGKVRSVLEQSDPAVGLSAEEVGAQMGVSRSTARRYLEYLVAVGVTYADLVYGSIGRPERRYFSI